MYGFRRITSTIIKYIQYKLDELSVDFLSKVNDTDSHYLLFVLDELFINL